MKTKERIDDESIAGKGKFVYLIAGKYAGGEVPEGMMLHELKVNLTSPGPAE